MNDDLLRKAYQARKQPTGGSERPTAEELDGLLAGRGTDEERLEILDRALAHPDSAKEFELLRAVAAAEKSESELRALATTAKSETVSRAMRWRVPLAVAATVTLVVSATLLGPLRRGSDIMRAPPPRGLPTPISPDDAAVTAPGSIQFVWHAVSNAGSYRLELVTEAGVEVATANTPDTTASVGVQGAGTYRWMVVALLPDGAEVLSSPRRLRITP